MAGDGKTPPASDWVGMGLLKSARFFELTPGASCGEQGTCSGLDLTQLIRNTHFMKTDKHTTTSISYAVDERGERPWGMWQVLDAGEGYAVKRIVVLPGKKLSLQRHHHRAEHWVVVSGTAKVVRDDENFFITENENTYLPQGCVHRLENPGLIPLIVIEVQTGSHLSEDDIVRLEDDYGRI